MIIRKYDNGYFVDDFSGEIVKDFHGQYSIIDVRETITKPIYDDKGNLIRIESEIKDNSQPPVWRLVEYKDDPLLNNENPITINGFPYYDGKYTGIVVHQGNMLRHFMYDSIYIGNKISDVIKKMNPDNISPEKEYHPNSNMNINADDYFKKTHVFIANDGEQYEGALSSNSYITNFLKANEELLKKIEEFEKQETYADQIINSRENKKR